MQMFAPAFKDYVTEYWVEGQERDQWNHFTNEGPRTNNHLEGWHSKLKKLVRHAHPNIYQLIELLKKTQANTEANQIQISAGATTRPKQKKYRNIDNRFATLKNRFLDQQMTVQEYADQASFCIRMELRQ